MTTRHLYEQIERDRPIIMEQVREIDRQLADHAMSAVQLLRMRQALLEEGVRVDRIAKMVDLAILKQ